MEEEARSLYATERGLCDRTIYVTNGINCRFICFLPLGHEGKHRGKPEWDFFWHNKEELEIVCPTCKGTGEGDISHTIKGYVHMCGECRGKKVRREWDSEYV